MKTRVSARIHKETQRRKTALESSSMPTKLVDCRSTNVEHSELFIVEVTRRWVLRVWRVLPRTGSATDSR